MYIEEISPKIHM